MSVWKEVIKKNRVAIIRHGNTNSVSITDQMTFEQKDKADLSRFLSEKGKEQCETASKKYLKSLLPLSNICIVSPAKRCYETKELFLQSIEKNCDFKTIEGKFLYPYHKNHQKSEELFSKLKYDTLNNYLKHENSIEFLQFGENALNEILKILSTEKPTEGTILIFSHAVYSNAIALKLSEILQIDSSSQMIKNVNLGEVEGFLLESDKVTYCTP
eukprot:gene6429-10437_t